MDAASLTVEAFRILLFLVPGYVALRIYYIDKPWNGMAPIHVFYGSLMFSAISYIIPVSVIVYLGIPIADMKIGATFLMATISSPIGIGVGLMWRKYGHTWLHDILIKHGITNEDNGNTSYMQLFNNPKIRLSQITIYTKDGSGYRCDDTKFFDTEELRSVGIFSHYTDASGDIYLAVNQVKEASSSTWEDVPDMNAEGWGLKVQFIRAGEIARVETRAIACSPPAPST